MSIIHYNQFLGMIANVTSNIAFVPQIFKSYKRKSVEDISIGMFLLLLFTQVCWILYALPIHAWELWTSSAIEIALLMPILCMWWKYNSKKNKAYLKDVPIEIASDA